MLLSHGYGAPRAGKRSGTFRTISMSWLGPLAAEDDIMAWFSKLSIVLLLAGGAAYAHHSAPVFYKVPPGTNN